MINNDSAQKFQQAPTLVTLAQGHKQRRVAFAITLLVIEIGVCIFLGFFFRADPQASEDSFQTGYPFYQDVNLMMLIGFGFLMTFVKSHQWSALSYTFMINAVVVQLYLLLQPFWHRVVHDDWNDRTVQITITSFTAASYSVASILIAFGGVLGRVGPLELLVMAMFGIVGYTLNEDIVYAQLKLLDAGGSTAIHTYGAYFGLACSAVLSKVRKPTSSAQTSKFSNSIAVFGTFFLWMFWPSFNAGYFPNNPLQRSLIVTNTICSLAGSCMAAFIFSSFFRHKFDMEDILNATLAGGVTIGAPSGLITNSAASIAIGLIAGSISTIGFIKIGPKLNSFLGLQDTCGINNLHGIPGLLGGVLSAIVLASYQRSKLGEEYQQFLPFSSTLSDRTYTQQAGYQLAGTGSSLGIGLVFGFIAGMVISCFYKYESFQFYSDKPHFETGSQYEKLNQSSMIQQQ